MRVKLDWKVIRSGRRAIPIEMGGGKRRRKEHPERENLVDSPLFFAGRGVQDSPCEAAGKTEAQTRS